MKAVFFVIAVIAALILFGLPIFGAFALLLAILGMAADLAVPVAMVITVVWAIAIGVKKFYIDE